MTDHYFIVSSADFQIHTESKCDLIQEAIKRYTDRFFVQDCSRLDAKLKGQHLFHKTPVTFEHDKTHLGELKSLHLKFSGTCEKYPHVSAK